MVRGIQKQILPHRDSHAKDPKQPFLCLKPNAAKLVALTLPSKGAFSLMPRPDNLLSPFGNGSSQYIVWGTDDETSYELSVGRPSGSAEDHIRTLVLRQNSDADVPGCNADDEGGEMIAA